jgi:hypothetical protein
MKRDLLLLTAALSAVLGLSACVDGYDRAWKAEAEEPSALATPAEPKPEEPKPAEPKPEEPKPEEPKPEEPKPEEPKPEEPKPEEPKPEEPMEEEPKPGEAGVGAPVPVPATGEMMTIRPEWPEPLFVGTPVPADLPNLEEPVGEENVQKEFQVPVGSENLAIGKSVISSEEFPPIIGSLDLVTDGETEGADGYYVELGPGPQWIQIDLEASADIYTLLVWHYHKTAVAYKDVVIQISDDPEFGEFVIIYNNDHDNTLGFGEGGDLAYVETNHGRIIELDEPVRGRYVRLHSNGNTANEMNHYIEVEVWGKTAE